MSEREELAALLEKLILARLNRDQPKPIGPDLAGSLIEAGYRKHVVDDAMVERMARFRSGASPESWINWSRKALTAALTPE